MTKYFLNRQELDELFYDRAVSLMEDYICYDYNYTWDDEHDSLLGYLVGLDLSSELCLDVEMSIEFSSGFYTWILENNLKVPDRREPYNRYQEFLYDYILSGMEDKLKQDFEDIKEDYLDYEGEDDTPWYKLS